MIMSERRELLLVRNDDGSWREWDNSLDDCMDRVETMKVREVLLGDPNLDDTMELLRETMERHAKLVEAARAVVQSYDANLIGAFGHDIEQLRAESEVDDGKSEGYFDVNWKYRN